MTNQMEVYRHELKYYISPREARALANNLKLYMLPDEHSGAGGYWIRSLYFDSMDNRDYNSKMMGCTHRKKMRLRIYSIHDATAKLELKIKEDNYLTKKSLPLLKQDVSAFLNGQSEVLLEYGIPSARDIYAAMHADLFRPVVLVDYEREAYLYPFENIRITLDRNVRACGNVEDLFSVDKPMVPVFDDERTILEVKFHSVLPSILRGLLSGLPAQASSVSKYCLCRQKIQI